MNKFNQNILVIILFLFSTFAYSITEAIIGTVPIEKNLNVFSLPANNSDTPEILISRDQYLISYNKNTHLLNWAAWKIESSNLGKVARTNIFMVDSDLETYLSQFSLHAPTPEDYHGSCFDRGHQCPSADRDSTVENNQATFFMSNMIPQTAYLNRIIWAHLEQYTRDLVEGQGKKVFVVAGPIFDEDFGKIGLNNDIPIPSKNFKIIYIMDKDLPMANINSTNVQTITTIMPNILRSGKKPLEDKVELCSNRNLQPITSNVSTVNDWEQFKSTPEEVERLSGIKLPNIK